MDLHFLWFLLLGVLLTGYAILDGFDLGVGILHLVAKKDNERRIFMNAIGPLWDGNEVWLVTFGGALFAAFPEVYATVFSGFYTAFMLLLLALIFRAVSMEFRSKQDSPAWRSCWDVVFFLSSTIAAFLFGVAVGNTLMGLPIGADREFQGNLLTLLRPFPILVGLFTVSLFAMHGSIYLYLKTEGDVQHRLRGWLWRTFGIFLFFYILTTSFALLSAPRTTSNFRNFPWAWGIVFLNILAIANIPRAIHLGKPVHAFISSCCTIAALNFLFAMALFPNLLVSNLNPDWSLTVYNASSSEKTLWIMAIFAFLGMPFVLAYTTVIYWTFRGKVQMDTSSY